MRTFRILVLPLLAVATTGGVLADPPKKEQLGKYQALWNDSPITSKPFECSPPLINPFEDYALSGVSPVEGGYYVILQNKKKPEERTILKPGASSEFRVVGVHKGTAGPLSTTVTLSNGMKTGEVKFDEKLLALAKPAAVPGTPPPSNQVGTVRPPHVRVAPKSNVR